MAAPDQDVFVDDRAEDYLLGTETTTITQQLFYPPPVAFDPGDLSDLTVHSVGAGRWGLPTDPPTELDPGAELLPGGYDYSGGMFVTSPQVDDDAIPGTYHPEIVGVHMVGIPPGIYRIPHEATHRRYEPPIQVPINQSAAGFTLVAPPTNGLHFIKVIAAFLTLDAAGTLQFTQGDIGGVTKTPMSGTINLGGGSASPLQLPMVDIQNPWLFTSPDQALGIVTATGKAQGWIVICNSPYDS